MKKDSEIQKDVMDELKWEPMLNACEIGVAVQNGVVTLSGTVDNYGKKIAAERSAKNVSGVRAVAEDIEVKLSSALGKKNDTELAAAVLNALKWHAAVPNEELKVKVEDGWVTLEGEVHWQFQKDAATKAVQFLTGLKGITNLITVKKTILAKDVKQKIAAAFHRSAMIDAAKVQVEIDDDKAILSGKVRSWAERDDAEKAAWNAPGIIAVENNLEIA